jgi:Zn-dependent protease with chaperone function
MLSPSDTDLGKILELPSESQIHFINFVSLCLLAWLYATLIPAIAILYGEHHPVAGTAFVGGSCLVLALSVRWQYRSQLALPPKRTLLHKVMQRAARGASRLRLSRLARYIRRFQVPELEEFVSPGKGEEFREFLRQRFIESNGDLDRVPAVFWSYQDLRCAARVAGTRSHPAVIVSAGLVSRYFRDPDVVRVYLLHEFAHLANRDLEILAATVAVLRGWRLTTLVATLVAASLLIPFIDGSIFTALLLMIATLWMLSLLVIWLFLSRYAGVVISLRELYADIQAFHRSGEKRELFERVIGASARPASRSRLGKFRSLTSLRLVHLSPGERLSFMARPLALVEPKTPYFFFIAALLLVIQSSPFLEGYGHNGLRMSLLLPWLLTAFAYAANVSRSVLGFARLSEDPGGLPRWRLGFYCTLLLLLPVVSIRGLYQFLFAVGEGWQSLRSVADDAFQGLAPRWGDLSTLLLLGCVLLILAQAGRLASEQSESPHRFHRRMLWIWGVGLTVETLCLAISKYESFHPTRWDEIGAVLYEYRALSPLLGMLAVLGLMFGTGRERRAARE